MHVEIRQRIAGLRGADLVRESEGAGFLVALVAVEQQARAQAVGRLPEILGGVLDLGVDDIGSRLAPGRGRGREGPQRPAFAADGVLQVGHLIGEARCRHGQNIRQEYIKRQIKRRKQYKQDRRLTRWNVMSYGQCVIL